jgi:D-serine deaminase-like pyridoxal phosphate-dependent protein
MIDTDSLVELPTPALVMDGAVVRQNIQRLADYAVVHHLNIRPHTKTHKSRQIAHLQMDSGAIGLTVAKFGEAEVMAEACDDLLLAYPALDPWRANHLAKLASRLTLHVAVDSINAVDALATAAKNYGSTIGILVDLDVGIGRTGVQSPQAALALAQRIDRTLGVRLDGILCYPGHIWSSVDQQGEPLAKVASSLQETLELWAQHGLRATIVSGGSTPTAYQSHLIPQTTEIRPGTYVFNDMNTVRGGFCSLDDCAARIISTVVSDAVPGQVVLDGGTKTFTSDLCIPARGSGHGYIVEYPQAKIVKLSEEHAQVDVTGCERPPSLGERVTIIPNHICPCVNLQDSAWWIEADDEPKQLRIDARGMIR